MKREEIKQLVAENKTEEVIKALLDLSKRIQDDDLKNSVILLSSRYNHFAKKSIDGTVDSEEQGISLAQLNQAALELIDKIPESIVAFQQQSFGQQASSPEPDELDRKLSKIVKGAVVGLFLFSVVCIIGSILYFFLAIAKNETGGEKETLFGFMPFSASLAGFMASGFFYFANKMVK